MANESIFEFADKFGYESPFGDWKPAITGGSFDPPKIVNAYILQNDKRKLEIIYLSKKENKDYTKIIPISIFVKVIGFADKVMIELEGFKKSALMCENPFIKFESIKDNIPEKKFGEKITYYSTSYDIDFRPKYQSKILTFIISVKGLNSTQINDSKSYTITLNLNGEITGQKLDTYTCVCTKDWTTIAPIVSKNNFIGWGYPAIKENCFDYAWEELKLSGFDLVSPSWRDLKSKKLKINEGIYQIYTSVAIAGLNAGVQKDQFKKGIEYLKSAIKENIPVLVGIEDQKGASNPDKVTDHFVIINGMGTDQIGSYFLFHDNATSDMDVGASSENKLYCNCDSYLLKGKPDIRNDYAYRYPRSGDYIVTQIRKSKKK